MEANGPLDDPGLVRVIEVREAVRDAPGAEREPDGENKSESQAECLVRPDRGGGASRRTPRRKLRFPKGSPHASPLTSVAPEQRMRAPAGAASSSSSPSSGDLGGRAARVAKTMPSPH